MRRVDGSSGLARRGLGAGWKTLRLVAVSALAAGLLTVALGGSGTLHSGPAAGPAPVLHVVADGGGDVPGCPAADPCSLSSAILQAHDATISLAAGVYSGPLIVDENLTLEGAGEGETILGEASGPGVVVDSVNATLSNLTIAGGLGSGELYGAGGVDNDGNLTLVDVSVTSNSVTDSIDGAGGIVNIGTLTLEDSTVSDNTGAGADDSCAGGVANDGTLVLEDSTVSGNTCEGSYVYGAGGITNGGYELAEDDEPSPSSSLTIEDSTVSGNSATSTSCGRGGCDQESSGGLLSTGPVTISGSTFSGNSGAVDGGGAYVDGALTVANSTFSDNEATRDGGAIDEGEHDSSTVTVSGSTFSGNTAGDNGGAIDSGDGYEATTGALDVFASTFSGNTAGDNGGAIDSGDDAGTGSLTVSGSTFSGDTAGGSGGAIDSGDDAGTGSLTVSWSTFSGNTAGYDGGAIDSGDDDGQGSLTVSGSTFSSNTASYDGGAIDSGDDFGTASLTVTESTFSGNAANALDGGAIDSGDDGGSGTLAVSHTTLAGDSAGNNGAEIDGGDGGGSAAVTVSADILAGRCNQASGSWTDSGYNVGTDASCLSSPLATGDDDSAGAGLSSELGPLVYNGGPAETIAPTAGNPAIGLIPSTDSALCPVVDERGAPSASGSACDAGSYQTSSGSYSASIALSPGTQSSLPGTTATVTATLEVDSVAAPAGFPVDFSVSGPDAETVSTLTGSGGTVALSITNDGTAGTDTISGASPIGSSGSTLQLSVITTGTEVIFGPLDQAPLSISTTTGTYPMALTLETAGGSGTGAVTFSLDSGGTGSCTLSGAVLTPAAAGTCIVTASKAGDSDYNPVSSSATTIAFAKGDQAPLVISTTSGVYGSSLTLETTGGSGTGGVSYSSDAGGSTTCSLSGAVLTAAGAGTCVVTAAKAADDDYNAISSSPTVVTFAKADQAALVISTTTASFASPLTLETSGGSGTGAVSYVLDPGGSPSCSLSGATLTVLAPGECVVTASKAADADYNAISSGATTITFGQASQSALLVSTLSGTYGTPLDLATSGGSGSGAVSFRLDPGGTTSCTLSGTTLTASSAGSCVVTAFKAADSDYSATASAPATITFAKADQAALVVATTRGVYGTALSLESAGGSGSGSVSYEVDNTGTAGCSLSGTVLRATAAGSCIVEATKAADSDYNAAESPAAVVVFLPAATTVTLTASPAQVVYGHEEAEHLSVRVAVPSSALVPSGVVTVSGTPCEIALSGGAGSCQLRATTFGAGLQRLVARFGGSSDFAPASSSVLALTVRKAATTTALTLSVPLTTYGREGGTRLSVTVSAAGRLVPVGRVQVAGTTCSIELVAGTGSCWLSPRELSVGRHRLVATYPGTADLAPSSSGPVVLVVAAAG